MEEWALVSFGGLMAVAAAILKVIPPRKNSNVTEKLCDARRQTTDSKLDTLGDHIVELKTDMKAVESTTTKILEAVDLGR